MSHPAALRVSETRRFSDAESLEVHWDPILKRPISEKAAAMTAKLKEQLREQARKLSRRASR